MALELEQFVKQLEDSGILPGETIREILSAQGGVNQSSPNPTGSGQVGPKAAEELARELIKQKKLTKFQAEELWRGRGKSLVLGNYVLLEKIGAGGMGQVFKAEHRRMQRKVAIKLLPSAMNRDKAAIARFEREVQAAARLRHPNIVAADDADQANGVHFLVMELVEGTDLAELVKKNGPISVDKAVNYILQAAKGLECAHSEGVIHRDIKPANLLLDKKGTVKILDMGLARIHGEEGKAELTTTGAVMGTVDYMAPEQAMNTKTADARADIYSLGCSFYYLLTGKATYEANSMMGKILAHRDQPVPVLKSTHPEMPDGIEVLFRKMVAKRAEDRFQTMTELLAALEGVAGNQEVSPPSFAESDPALTRFFNELIIPPKSVVRNKSPNAGSKGIGGDFFSDKRKWLIGGGILGFLFLFGGIFFTLKTRDGTLIVEVNEPDAEVVVLNDQGKVEITRKGNMGPITISVDPGKHRLKVQKDGFEFFSKDFEIESGGKKSITAKLLPLEKKSAVVTATQPGKNPVIIPTKIPKPTGSQPPIAIAPFNSEQARKHQEAWARYLQLPMEFTNSLGMKFVLIPPGEFMMGCEEKEIEAFLKKIRKSDDPVLVKNFLAFSTPQHSVQITRPFYMQTSEVTNGIYQKMLGKLPEFNDQEKTEAPVMSNISLAEASAFCNALNQKEGKAPTYRIVDGKPKRIVDANGYRLPTEGEWEYACRAGTTTWWFFGEKGVNESLGDYQTLHRGSAVKPNPFGLFDMYGGSSEWCFDGWLPYGPGSTIDPFNEPNDMLGVARGGSEFANGGGDLGTINSVTRQPLKGFGFQKRWYGLGRVVLPIEMKVVNNLPKPAVGVKLFLNDPGFDSWKQNVVAMSAEKQLEVVGKKLMELNPGFDGKITGAQRDTSPRVENGMVTELAFSADHVTDISPVQALTGLTTFICEGSSLKKGKLSDLSPLKGMNLSMLSFLFTQVSDLSPLEGMSLTSLECGETQVSDLSPLKRMPRLRALLLASCPVSDLSSLVGLPLDHVNLHGTKVSDISPLKGMKLGWGLLIGDTRVSDLTPLRGMPLQQLWVNGTPVSDYSPLKGVPLKKIWCEIKPERDTEILRSIKTLETINDKAVGDFWKEIEDQKKKR